MNNKLSFSTLAAAGLCLVASVGFYYFYQTEETVVSSKLDVQSANTDDLAARQAKVATSSAITKKVATLAVIEPSAGPQQAEASSLKTFDEDWCVAFEELSAEDYRLAQSQQADWDEYQGVGKVKWGSRINSSDERYPGNSFVVSYQELPKQELRALAVAGDKWAMVAYIQGPYGDNKFKIDIAKQLLVMGATHHALHFLVKRSMIAAKTTDSKEATKQAATALSYALWGVEHYSTKGLLAYFALGSGSFFGDYTKPDVLLQHAGVSVQQQYDALSAWVEEEREKLGISAQQPPKAAIRDFAESVAYYRYQHPESIELIGSLAITESDRFNNTPCVNEGLAGFIESSR